MIQTQEPKLFGIYHTHSNFSKFNHGKDSAEDMINSAKELGLIEYAITDHGYKHFFGIRKKNVKKLRAIIDEANKVGETKTLMGMELNILGTNGEVDITPEMDELLDIRLMGAHRAGMVNIKNFFKFILPNLFNGKSRKVIERNTDAYINAIKKHKIDIITHPQEYIRVNLVRLAKACVENNCYLEINNKHLNMTKAEVQEILDTGVKFVINSDAHKKDYILRVDRALEFARECEIPEDQIANLNKLPNFKEKY